MFWITRALAEGDVAEGIVETAEAVVEEAVNMNIGVGESLMYAVVGFLVVFVVLFIIIGAIVVTSKLMNTGAKKEKAPVAAPAPVAPVAVAPVAAPVAAAVAPGSCGELKTYNVSDKECAMIMAIVADELKTPLNELRFISIKEIEK